MFDFFSPEFFSPYRVTFTDINGNYLKCLKSRVKSKAQLRFRTVVDDIERSQLPAGFTLAVAVLVLEHVDWHLAVASLCRLTIDSVFVVIQENPPKSTTAVSESQPIVGTMRIFMEVHPRLVNREELVQEFDHHGFVMAYSNEQTCPLRKEDGWVRICKEDALKDTPLPRKDVGSKRPGPEMRVLGWTR